MKCGTIRLNYKTHVNNIKKLSSYLQGNLTHHHRYKRILIIFSKRSDVHFEEQMKSMDSERNAYLCRRDIYLTLTYEL